MSTTGKKILYVGADDAENPDFRLRLARINPQWEVFFCSRSSEALEFLAQSKFDAIISDDQLPDMDGFHFLDAVQQRHPEIRRVLVSELTDRKSAVKIAGVAHHCVPKPCDVETLRETLDRTFALNVWLSNPAVRGLVRRMTVVPSPPDLYFEVVRALRAPDVDIEKIAQRAAQDPAMTAKLLQLANSAAIGLRHRVTSVQSAIGYLGLETTRSLILLAHTFSYCDKTRLAGFSIEALWRHSLRTGLLARAIARHEDAPAETVDEAFLAGLLHDIGELLMAVNIPEDYARVIARARQCKVPLWQAEFELLQATHAELGAELMAIWGLPLTVVEALALHHHPAKLLSTSFCPLAAVHVADSVEHEISGPASPLPDNTIDPTYLADLGLEDRLEPWREVCHEELTPKIGR